MYDEPETGTHRKVISPAYCRNPLHSGRGGGQVNDEIKMEKSLSLKTTPKRILVIAMRYLGDLLLATPLLHSLRNAYPNAQLHVLVYQNTAAILEGNTDIDKIITTSQHPSGQETRVLCQSIFRRYDLACAIETGDRRYLYAWLAAPQRIALTPPKSAKDSWKRHLVQGWVEYDEDQSHTLLTLLKLAQVLGIPLHYTVIPPKNTNSHAIFQTLSLPSHYAVLHLYPQWRYKRWTTQGWLETAEFLIKQGLKLVLTGSPDPQECDYIARFQTHLPAGTINVAGKTTLAELSHIIKQACLFIGPDTGITHLAAATGTPVIALYGPTNPIKWAPWPAGFSADRNPFNRIGDQQVNNVFLIQGKADCVPCQLEGCERHRDSDSECLKTLSAKPVIKAIEKILEN